jgi:hypothetical protein
MLVRAAFVPSESYRLVSVGRAWYGSLVQQDEVGLHSQEDLVATCAAGARQVGLHNEDQSHTHSPSPSLSLAG